MTYRAVKILKKARLILAEDTRHTKKLLDHYDIQSPLRPYHKFNEDQITGNIVNQLEKDDQAYAVVSSAGMPGISDPGYLIINQCIQSNVKVECLPGATAFVPALVNSGIPSDRFCFEGFLPHKKGRNKRLKALQAEERTMIFYESPFRLVKTLNQFCEFFGETRRGSVSRELTKIYEETVSGTLKEITHDFSTKKIKGEFVIIVEGKK